MHCPFSSTLPSVHCNVDVLIQVGAQVEAWPQIQAKGLMQLY